MNKIIPFNKEIEFPSKIDEVTSIALDDTLKFDDPLTIRGDLIVRGCYKTIDKEEDFSYPIPAVIAVDEKYDTDKAKISVDDFYYEIINDNILRVKIDLLLDNLYYKEKKIIEERIEVNEEDNNLEEVDNKLSDEINDEKKDKDLDLKEYCIYRVYLVDENDTIEKIMEKYHVTKEDIEEYNDLSNIKAGMKLIIPSIDE